MLCSSIQFDNFFSAGTSSNLCGQGREAAHCLANILKRTDRDRRPVKQPSTLTPTRSASTLTSLLLPDLELLIHDDPTVSDDYGGFDEEYVMTIVQSIMETLDCGDLLGAEDDLRQLIDDERLGSNRLCSGILHSILGFVLWEQRNMDEAAIAFGAALNVLVGLDHRTSGFSRNFHMAIAFAHLAFFAHNDALDAEETHASEFEVRRNFDEAIRMYEKSLSCLEDSKHAGLASRTCAATPLPVTSVKKGILEGYGAMVEDYARFLVRDLPYGRRSERAKDLLAQADAYKASARKIGEQSWVVRFVH